MECKGITSPHEYKLVSIMNQYPVPDYVMPILPLLNLNRLDYALYCRWYDIVSSQDASVITDYIRELPRVYPLPAIAHLWSNLPRYIQLFIYLSLHPNNVRN